MSTVGKHWQSPVILTDTGAADRPSAGQLALSPSPDF